MAGPQIKIFARTNSPRLSYIAGILLGDMLGLSWEIVNDRRRVGKCAVINYSTENTGSSFNIIPDQLLFEKGLTERQIRVSRWNDLPVFFQTSCGSDLPFDIFAASFFLVTRYEEYLNHQPDIHGRFRASSSLAFAEGFLDKPVVDLWARELAKALLRKFPALVFRKNEFRSLLTVDSDQPFAYRGKKLIVNIGGFVRDIAANPSRAAERYRVLFRGEKDPYQVYDYIIGQIQKYGTSAKFFFPTGDYSEFDKNPSWKCREYRDLICNVASLYSIGIHPSYYSGDKGSKLKTETGRLVSITGTRVLSGRYHYIRISMPSAYRAVNKLGITEEYSMGYPDEPGYRAGIARPFFFYDVEEDIQTSLRIVPFQVMDGTLFQYKNLDPSAGGEVISKYIEETRRAGGIFVSIWHNTSLLGSPQWKGWREIFERMLKEQQP